MSPIFILIKENINNMIKRLFLALCIILVFTYVACQNAELKESDELFYNPYIQHIIKYNKQFKDISLLDATENQFQYQVANKSNLYIDGNSLTNGFRLIQLNKDSISEIYKFNKNEGVFPIGIIGEKLYCVHAYYKVNGEEKTEKRRVGVFDLNTKKLIDFTNTKGLVSYGGVGKDYIYYTVYHDSSNTYSLMRVKINVIDSIPEQIKDSLIDGRIIVSNDDLYYSNGNNLFCGEKKYKIESENFIEKNSLIQFYPNSYGRLCIKIINLQNNNVFEDEDICGIRFENDYLMICKLSGVISYAL